MGTSLKGNNNRQIERGTMKLQTLISKSTHGDFATCVAWINSDELVTCGDDHKIKIWSATTLDILKEFNLPETTFPVSLDAIPKTGTTRGSEVFALSSSDGKVHLLNRTGRLDKSVDAHSGAALCVRWSPDSSAIVSSGEDGLVKIWSKNLMLRSTFSAQGSAVYSITWNPFSDSLAFSAGDRIEVKALSPNSRPVTWRGHDCVILSLSWNHNNLIVSGGEDRRYKIWDSFGRLQYSSFPLDHPITSMSWSQDASLIVIGSFNQLQFADKIGVVHDTGIFTEPVYSVYAVSWSQDGSQVAGVSSSGHLILSTVIERHHQWKTWDVVSKDRKRVEVTEVVKDSNDELEFKDIVVRMSVSFGHLIVITSSQGFIYKLGGTNILSGHHTFDVRSSGSAIHLICQSDRYFLLVGSINVTLLSYDGRQLHNLKWTGMRPENLNDQILSLSPDTLAVKDAADVKSVTFIDTQTGKVVTSFHHTIEIATISLDQVGSPTDRKLAFIDKNSDLYVHLIRATHGLLVQSIKLQSMMSQVRWSEDHDILCGTSESSKLFAWSYPQVAFVDRELVTATVAERILPQKASTIEEFNGSSILLRSTDGNLIQEGIHPLLPVLHSLAQNKKWKECLSLCRLISSSSHSDKRLLFWSTLAGMALVTRDLDLCEVCYSEIDRVDKVNYIQRIKDMKDTAARSAEVALLTGNTKEAESILLQSGFILRAILLDLELFQWTRALDIAMEADKNPRQDVKLVRLVLSFRRRYLDNFNREEDLKPFIQLVEELGEEEEIADWKTFSEIIKNPYEKKSSSVKISSASSSQRVVRGR